MDAKTVVRKATSALHDLYGLIPTSERTHADDYVRVLEQALSACNETLDRMRQIEAAVYFSNQFVEQRIAEIEAIEKGD